MSAPHAYSVSAGPYHEAMIHPHYRVKGVGLRNTAPRDVLQLLRGLDLERREDDDWQPGGGRGG